MTIHEVAGHIDEYRARFGYPPRELILTEAQLREVAADVGLRGTLVHVDVNQATMLFDIPVRVVDLNGWDAQGELDLSRSGVAS